MYKYNICIISVISIIVPASMGVLADISAASERSYGQQHSFQILSTFSYDNFASQPTGRHSTMAQYVSFYLNLPVIV